MVDACTPAPPYGNNPTIQQSNITFISEKTRALIGVDKEINAFPSEYT